MDVIVISVVGFMLWRWIIRPNIFPTWDKAMIDIEAKRHAKQRIKGAPKRQPQHIQQPDLQPGPQLPGLDLDEKIGKWVLDSEHQVTTEATMVNGNLVFFAYHSEVQFLANNPSLSKLFDRLLEIYEDDPCPVVVKMPDVVKDVKDGNDMTEKLMGSMYLILVNNTVQTVDQFNIRPVDGDIE